MVAPDRESPGGRGERDSGLDRRELVKRAVVGGALVWTPPVVDSILNPVGAQQSNLPAGLYRASFGPSPVNPGRCSGVTPTGFVEPYNLPVRVPAVNGQQCTPATWNNLTEYPGVVAISKGFDAVTAEPTYVLAILAGNCVFADTTRNRCNTPNPCCRDGTLDASAKVATHRPCRCCAACLDGGAPCPGTAAAGNPPYVVQNMIIRCV